MSSAAQTCTGARGVAERKLADAVGEIVAMTDSGALDPQRGALELFDACVPAIPYAAASAFLGREKFKLTRSDGDRPRVALVADGLSGMHGVTHTIQQIRDRGIPGYEVDVIGTDADVDRRLSAVAEIDIPFYRGLKIGVPSVPAIVDALAEGRYDLVHLCSPGPAGVGAWLLARVLELPVIGSYHTELAAYAGLRIGQEHLEALAGMALGAFYGACDIVLSPSPASDERLVRLGINIERVARWDRGVDLERFDPALRTSGLLPDAVNVLYAGRLTKEKGVELLADAFETARRRDPRLHLVLAGRQQARGGGAQTATRGRRHLPGLADRQRLPGSRLLASATCTLFASRTDTFGQVILEAQASGLPVVAVAEGGRVSLITHNGTGLLANPDASALAEAVLSLTSEPLTRERVRRNASQAVRGRTWKASLEQLAAGYRSVLERSPESDRRVA